MSHQEEKSRPKLDFPSIKELRWKKAISDNRRWIAGAGLAVCLVLIIALIFGISHQSLKKEGKFSKEVCI